jgi:hypothetical protein
MALRAKQVALVDNLLKKFLYLTVRNVVFIKYTYSGVVNMRVFYLESLRFV